jgi:hypothetical protein
MFAATTDTSLAEILEALENFVAVLEPGGYTPDDVRVVLGRIVKAEKLCGAARLLLANRAASLLSDARDGHSSPAKWLAEQSGESVGQARRDLEVAEQLKAQPELADALRTGKLSATQASAILPALRADPGSAPQMIDAARSDSLNVLRERSRC